MIMTVALTSVSVSPPQTTGSPELANTTAATEPPCQPHANAYADSELEVIAGYTVHPLASRFDLIVGEEFDKLTEAAERAGRLYPAETHEGLLIDGRNRLRVQQELHHRGIDIEVPVVEWEPTGDETVEEHIWSVNMNRRHMTPDQRAVLALEFLPHIQAARQVRQKASRFGTNGVDTAAVISPPPSDGQAGKPRRTSAEKDAASTAGGLAALAKVSTYKAGQAVALYKAVEAGDASESEIDAVLAGDKTLSAAVPRRKKNRKQKTQADHWDAVDDEAANINAAPAPCEEEARRRWKLQTSDFAIADLPDWRRLFMKVIHEEQQMYGS